MLTSGVFKELFCCVYVCCNFKDLIIDEPFAVVQVSFVLQIGVVCDMFFNQGCCIPFLVWERCVELFVFSLFLMHMVLLVCCMFIWVIKRTMFLIEADIIRRGIVY